MSHPSGIKKKLFTGCFDPSHSFCILEITMNKTNASPPSTPIVENKVAIVPSTHTIKRSVSGEIDAPSKKIMVHHQLEQNDQYSTTASFPAKFVRASQVAAMNNMNINAIPEISDQELLEMALIFEKKHPQ
ncbi:unnamed protein product [Adineta steineri]|uniref:Uncharacterized protein n=1 Tax=Adineta steineri TaxID=433720 RepID=A0A815HQ77_9BILA|nr:unnamed protein product [Adineta steineri]CAF1557383.1 unnamed protein product [Adineta steineri]CAF1599074.1 unnamed protein product [Adineta steineri]CAF1663512.1 unnamed protein product [Adineta steineri]